MERIETTRRNKGNDVDLRRTFYFSQRQLWLPKAILAVTSDKISKHNVL